MKLQNKSGFTILELMIVLLIMGLIYSLSITSFSKKNIQDQNIYFNLKKILISYVDKEYKIIELIVYEDDTYDVLVDAKVYNSKKLLLPKDIEFFSYKQDGLLKEKFKSHYKDKYFKNVKFIFKIYDNGSATKSIVFTDDKYFIQSNYFKDEKVFETLNEAQEYLQLEIFKHSMVEVSE